MTPRDDLKRLAAMGRSHADAIAAAHRDGVLANWLYHNWYLVPATGFAPVIEPQLPFDRVGSSLCGVIDRIGSWTEDWVVLSIGTDGSLLASRDGVVRPAMIGHYASVDRPGLPAVPGVRVSLPPLLSWVDGQTGQWAAQSLLPPDAPLLRLYLNVGAADVGLAVAALAASLAERQTRFSMKCPGTPNGFARADALVVYLNRADWQSCADPLLRALGVSAIRLRSGTPAMTRRLADGIAVADDPGDGQSYGQSRCAILAPALAQVLVQNDLDLGTIVDVFESALSDAGLDPADPWNVGT